MPIENNAFHRNKIIPFIYFTNQVEVAVAFLVLLSYLLSYLRATNDRKQKFFWCTGLFKKKNTLSKIYFTKTADAKSMSCVRMEGKSLKILISIIWSGASLRLWLLLPVTCCDECGKSWIIDLTSAVSHVGLARVLVRCENNFENSPFSLYIALRHMFNSTCKINFWKCILLFE
jgi:hypothetical protein